MKFVKPIDPAWRTDTVVQLCLALREAQDFSQAPILADALQDAGCDVDEILSVLRNPNERYAVLASVVACVLSHEHALAVGELYDFSNGRDCPDYVVLLEAAAGIDRMTEPGYGGEIRADNDGGCLMFWGADAHGEIPDFFWDLIQKVTGKPVDVTGRAKYFGCSC